MSTTAVDSEVSPKRGQRLVRRIVAFLILALVAAFACYRFWPREQPPRIVEWPAGAGIGVSNMEPNVPVSFDDMAVCLDKPGRVTIDKVAIANPQGGLRLRAFSVRRSGEDGQFQYISKSRTTLVAAGFPQRGPFVVSTVCGGEHPRSTLIAVELDRPDNGQVAAGTGFVVDYTSNGKDLTVFLPFGIMLCPGNAEKREDCLAAEAARPPA
jgi:hypothetical protein